MKCPKCGKEVKLGFLDSLIFSCEHSVVDLFDEIEQLKHDFKVSQQYSMGKDQEVKWLKEKLDVLQTKYDHNLKADEINKKEVDKK